MEEGLIKKAELIHGGDILLPRGFEPPFRLSHSTAGPGAGTDSAVFSFGGYRVKKTVSRTAGDFELRVEDGAMSLYRGGEVFLERVEIVPVVRHCPDQAFFNLSPGCIHDCAYCNSPLLGPSEDKRLTPERVLELLAEDGAVRPVVAAAFTSGVSGSVEASVDRMAAVVSAVRAAYPRITIGVEPYVDSADQIAALRDAGADEIKLNVECARRDIFERMCPGLDYDNVFEMLRCCQPYFRKGSVASNIVYGLGETDQDVDMTMERLCRMNVLPGLRMVRVNDGNRERLRAAGAPETPPTVLRSLFLSGLQKSIMSRHGLDPSRFRTMCFNCRCCDLVPFADFRSGPSPAPGADRTCSIRRASAPRTGGTGAAPCGGGPHGASA